MAVDAVIFDLDGVLVDSEQVWGAMREQLTRELGGRWHPGALREMMGMSSLEWSRYMHEELGVPLEPAAISEQVAAAVAEEYHRALPLLPGAVEAVRALGKRWPLALASSANRSLIDLVLDEAGLAACFRTTVSSEEVPRGKPAPDVYRAAARLLGVDTYDCAAIEDSSNGMRSAHAAGMRLVAIPNRAFPPDPDAVRLAEVVLTDVTELTPEAIAGGL
jgi:HAD superfamily hydrolase (TIGR01509 family)